MSEQQRTIALLKAADPGAIRQVYTEHRERCLGFLQSFGLSHAESEDVYQDAMIALVENVRKGKLDQLQSALSTYLFAIAKYMAYKRLRDNRKTSSFSDVAETEALSVMAASDVDWQDHAEEEQDETVQVLRRHLAQLGSRCRDIMRMAYFEDKSADEIAEALGYPNKDVLKSTKSRCLRQLRDLFNQKHHG